MTLNITAKDIYYSKLKREDFQALIALANKVHGDGYLDQQTLLCWYQQGLKILKKQADVQNIEPRQTINASFVAYHHNKLVGFRITFANKIWQIDQWSTPKLWQVAAENVCYFKCNTVDENYRSLGIGSKMLNLSIAAAKQQGASAGVSHLWKQSPGNSAIKYFSKCGGKLVKSHPDKWHEESQNGYDCILCGLDCHCEAAEMIIYF